jgi:hypothetical protein
MKRYICAWFVVLFLPTVALAECPTQETVILYLNGIDTTEKSAIASQDRIKKEVSKIPGVLKDCIKYDYLYNTNEPGDLDLVEAAIQKLNEQGISMSEFWGRWFRLIPAITGDWFLTLVSDYYFKTNESVDLGRFILGDQVDEHLVKIRGYLAQGKRVILVSHSQGNLYANEEWNKLTEAEKSQVDIVAAATPANYVAKNNDLYTTLTEDWIATLFPRALAANTSNAEPCSDDWTCHGFKESYMKGGNSRERIVEEIAALLPVPETCRVEGIVKDLDFRTIISEAKVKLWTWDNNALIWKLVTETKSDSSGHYCLTDIADGDYLLNAYNKNEYSLGGRAVWIRSNQMEPIIINFPIPVLM